MGEATTQIVGAGNEPRHCIISVPIISQLGTPAQEALREALQRFADDVAREAGRLELGERATNSPHPEFTSRMVSDAEVFVRRRPRTPPAKSRLDRASEISFAISGPGFGLMGNYFHSPWQGAVFAGLLVVWIITLVRHLLKKGGSEL